MSETITFNIKKQYFDAIKSGQKTEEYRLVNPYWTKRIVDREYKMASFRLGYPKRGDAERIITRPYGGYEVKTITHPHFGDTPVDVFAVRVMAVTKDDSQDPNE